MTLELKPRQFALQLVGQYINPASGKWVEEVHTIGSFNSDNWQRARKLFVEQVQRADRRGYEIFLNIAGVKFPVTTYNEALKLTEITWVPEASLELTHRRTPSERGIKASTFDGLIDEWAALDPRYPVTAEDLTDVLIHLINFINQVATQSVSGATNTGDN